jgi:hypothetical protein
VSIGLSLFAVALYVVYIASIVNRTVKLRSRILARMGPLRTREALDLPLRDTEHWLEPTFAAVRAWKATGQLLLSRIVFPAVSRGVLAVAGLLLSVWFDNALLVGLSAGLFLYQSVAITRLGRYYQRLSLPGVGDVLAKDSRAPILFLRPFALDEVPVSPLEDGWYGIRDISLSLDRRTFEEALKVVFDDIGPIIAIGRSGEGAAPIGAAREYTDDTSWQQRVLERADIAQFVIIACDATPSMIWEIQNVSKRLGLRRIVMVLPLDDHGYQKRAPEWYARWASLRDKFAFLPEVSDDAVAVMFDKDDAAIVVSSDASSLEKRLTTIKEAWLENSR